MGKGKGKGRWRGVGGGEGKGRGGKGGEGEGKGKGTRCVGTSDFFAFARMRWDRVGWGIWNDGAVIELD